MASRTKMEVRSDRHGYVGVLIEGGELVAMTLHAASYEIALEAIRAYRKGRAAWLRRRKPR